MSLCEDIIDNCKDASNYLDYTNFKLVIDFANNIDSYIYDIHTYIDTAKDNGIQNEDSLYEGKDEIEQLELQVEELEDELSSLLAGKTNSIKRLKKQSRYICNVHDEIMDTCNKYREDLNRITILLSSGYDNEDQVEFENALTELCDIGNMFKYEIEDLIDEARELNEKMSNGIQSKNEKIEKLQEEIQDLQSKIQQNS